MDEVNNDKPRIGHISVGWGPMWAEKTTWMISQLRKAELVGKRAMAISYSEDNRYSEDSIATHSGLIYKEVVVQKMSVITPDDCAAIAAKYDFVAIDEGQFFPDIAERAVDLAKRGCDVVITCLSGDFEQKMFPEVSKLLPRADKIHHFRAICMMCRGKKAPYTIRLDKDNKSQKDIGGADKYAVVCAQCLHSGAWVRLVCNTKQ
jgi:thymidine kinase